MEDDSALSEDLIAADDDEMVNYLKILITHGEIWPNNFLRVDVFNKDPREEFNSKNPIFVFVKSRAETCGKTDGCESGCWRIIGRDKLIKYEGTEKILGFKKILKFCVKNKPREYKRSWVMEEYRLLNKGNQDHQPVICKIRFVFEKEICFLLAKHFSYLKTTSLLPANQLLPAYGNGLYDPHEEDVAYLQTIIDYDQNKWPSYVTNDVYRLHPMKLVDHTQDQMFIDYGTCIFAKRKQTCGETFECDGGYWRVMYRDRLIRSNTGEIMGFKRLFKFWENQERRFVEEGGKVIRLAWTIEEYRLAEEVMQKKVLCVIELREIAKGLGTIT